MSQLKQMFVMSEARESSRRSPTDKAREQVSRRIQRAFIEIDRAAASGKFDVAASEANFAGQDIDGIFRMLAQSILGGAK